MKRSNTTRALGARFLSRAFLLALALTLPMTVTAQETRPAKPQAQADKQPSRFSARAGLGFSASPETFLMTLEVPWAVDELVSVGPLFQLGFSDDDTLFASTLQVYLNPRFEGDLDVLRPYAHMGMGLIYLENDDRAPGRDEEDTDFLFTMGLGMEYAFSEEFFLGTGLLFNVVPTGVVGEKFVFGWQLLTFRAAF